jgi:hypothetical protein
MKTLSIALPLVLGCACLATSTFGSGVAAASSLDFNKDCSSPVDYHRTPIVRWECFESFKKGDSPGYQNSVAYLCDGINENNFFGRTHFTCASDHASFDAHYAAEARKPRAADRDQRTPRDYCDNIATIMRGAAANSHGIFGYAEGTARRSENTEKDFVSKVRTFRCVYDEKNPLAVTLQNGTLTVTMNSTAATEGNWLEDQIRKLFPAYGAWYTEHS